MEIVWMEVLVLIDVRHEDCVMEGCGIRSPL
jgi:hypothetical protein